MCGRSTRRETGWRGTITLTKSTYVPATDSLNYTFTANQGPKVEVLVEGIKVSKPRLKLLGADL